MSISTWLIFALAALGLSLSPGPNGLLALTHGALYGPRRAAWTIAGGLSGFTVLIALSMFGIAALLQQSATALQLLKWVGGAYLAWLGIGVWRSPPMTMGDDRRVEVPQPAALFRQGLLSAVTNPKGLLFFAAFLPQFVDPARSLTLQFMIMAGTFAVTEALTEGLLAGAAHRIRPWMARVGRRFNQVCGGLFVLLGLALPLRG